MRRKAPRRLRKRHARGEVRAAVDEAIALFYRLRWVAEQIYGPDGGTTAQRGILRGLLRYGPQTVPVLARARAVTRQNVQPVVDALVADGLAELVDNPSHARSPLVRVTTLGEQLVHRTDAIDARLLESIGADVASSDLEITARTLEALRLRFEDPIRWRRALAKARG